MRCHRSAPLAPASARRTSTAARALSIAAVVSGLLAGTATAAPKPGDRDPSFGDSGIAAPWATDQYCYPCAAADAAVQPDGKIVVVGEFQDKFAIARLDHDGTPDASFGTDGVTTVDVAVGEDRAYAVRLLSDGSMFVAGAAGLGYGRASESTGVVKLTPGGKLDGGFGTGGKVTVQPPPDDHSIVNYRIGHSMLALSTGRPVVLTGDDLDTYELIRLTTKGALDETFGGTGTVDVPRRSRIYTAWRALAPGPAGSVVVGGSEGGVTYTQGGVIRHGDAYGLARFTDDGKPDNGFGDHGFSFVPQNADDGDFHASAYMSAIAPGPNGSILGWGWRGWDAPDPNDPSRRTLQPHPGTGIALVRFNSTGGEAGETLVPTDPHTGSRSMSVAPDGSVLGLYFRYVEKNGEASRDSAVFVVRFLNPATRDTGFGSNGVASANFTNYFDFNFTYPAIGDDTKSVAGDLRGRPLLVGLEGAAQATATKGAVMRLFLPVPDRTAPKVTIARPRNGARYKQGARVRAKYSCSDAHLKRCIGTVADGKRIATSTKGKHRFKVVAVDQSGNRTVESISYRIVRKHKKHKKHRH